jgi:hypothetical protein
MIYVIFSVKGCYVGGSKRTTALVTEKVKTSEIVCFAKRILAFAILVFSWEEF